MANKIYTLSKQTAEKLPGILRAFESGGADSPLRKYPLQIGTLEITGEWTDAQGIFSATAKRLFKTDNGYEARENTEDITLYAATFTSAPPLSAGQRCNAFYDGTWQLISGGSTSAALYAVVMENIQCPADTTKTPDDEDFYSKLGRVKILGKEYENTGTEDEPEYDYDYCACLELAGKDDDYPEQILKGTQVKIIKSGTFDNPDYIAPDPEADPPVEGTPDEPEKLDWYVAVETGGYYTAAIDANIASGETGTFTIDENQFSVHGNLIPEGFTAETGTTYRIERSVFNGGVLQLVGGECPQKEAT
ncbi:hypothetical protein FACS18942_04900 [Planctomycetales bacterium]|nr:hypothetical protein FACS18942_04900 [Planctomycetales bacterium]GHT33818.1 hypothetical protein FACS189427_00060 [Planctomycetales bacterium]